MRWPPRPALLQPRILGRERSARLYTEDIVPPPGTSRASTGWVRAAGIDAGWARRRAAGLKRLRTPRVARPLAGGGSPGASVLPVSAFWLAGLVPGWDRRPGRLEAFGGLTSGGCLGGVVLGFAEVGDGFDEPGKAGHERELGQDGIAAGERGTGHETGRAAKVVPGRGWTRNASVGHAGGAVVGVGGLADHPVARELGP